MKMPWFESDSPLEEPNSVTQKQMHDHVTALVGIIKSMSGYTDFRAQTIVFWCIATYGFEDLRKFPILVIRGAFGTGKTTTLEICLLYTSPSPRD